MFYPWLCPLPLFPLDVFVKVGGRVTTEMMVLIEVLQQIRNNHTHKTFVEQLRPSLDDMTDAVRDLLRETRGHVCAFAACPEFLRGCVAMMRKLTLRGGNAHVKHHHHHHHRHHHHRHASRYDPITPTRMSDADLDVEMMAMINNNDDDDSVSDSDSDSDNDSGNEDGDNDDSDANDDSEVGEINDSDIDDVMVTLDGDDNRFDGMRGGKGKDEGEDESERNDLEKAASILLANAPTAASTAAAATGVATTVGTTNITINSSHIDSVVPAVTNDSSIGILQANNEHDAEHGPLLRLQRARTGLLEGYRRTRELFVFPKTPSTTPQTSRKQDISSDNYRASARGSVRTSTRAGFLR